MLFGLHLMKRGVISADQLVAAIDVQHSTLVPIGQLALEEGMLTARDVLTILLAQHDAPAVLFGELAIERSLLTRDDVMKLLMIQADRKRSIAEILVSHGVVSQGQIDSELAIYRELSLRPQRPPAKVSVIPRPRCLAQPKSASDSLTTV